MKTIIEDIAWEIRYQYRKFSTSIKNIIFFLKNGFLPSDWWGYATKNTERTIKILKHFQKNHYGYPSNLKTPEDWDKTLQIMIDGFEACLEMDKMDYFGNEEKYSELIKIFKKGMNVYSKYYLDLWD